MLPQGLEIALYAAYDFSCLYIQKYIAILFFIISSSELTYS
jgi:hypothetical protein